MDADARRDETPDPRDRYRGGLPDHHDPLGGVGGAAPAYSALTLRLGLAIFGFIVCGAFAVWLVTIDAPAMFVGLLMLLAVVALIDIVVIGRRKRRGEPG